LNGQSSPTGTEFAVLVDTTPMPPASTLRYFARNDEACLRTPGCPSSSYLQREGVLVTHETQLTIKGLSDKRPRGRKSTEDRHQIMIIPLGPGGRRVGEQAYTVTMFVDRGH